MVNLPWETGKEVKSPFTAVKGHLYIYVHTHDREKHIK